VICQVAVVEELVLKLGLEDRGVVFKGFDGLLMLDQVVGALHLVDSVDYPTGNHNCPLALRAAHG
jgi:hypothetical protein